MNWINAKLYVEMFFEDGTKTSISDWEFPDPEARPIRGEYVQSKDGSKVIEIVSAHWYFNKDKKVNALRYTVKIVDRCPVV